MNLIHKKSPVRPFFAVMRAFGQIQGLQWGTYGLVLALSLSGCKSERHAPVALVTQAGKQSFEPKVVFAEYLELPGVHNELKITLASYEASCDRFVAPHDGEIAVTVVLIFPPNQRPTPGTYAWAGTTAMADAGPLLPAQAYAVPKAFIGKEGYVFRPGGAIQLTRLVLEPNGFVEGMLGFEFVGDGTSAASSLKGPFTARFCRLEPASELRPVEAKSSGSKKGSKDGAKDAGTP